MERRDSLIVMGAISSIAAGIVAGSFAVRATWSDAQSVSRLTQVLATFPVSLSRERSAFASAISSSKEASSASISVPVRMLFVGDLMFDRTVRARSVAFGDPLYPFVGIRTTHPRFFRDQDAVIGNLEGPVTTERRPTAKSISFAFAPTIPAVLQEVGFSAVSLANNHSLDQGRAGDEDTHRALAQAGIVAFGNELSDDAAFSLAMSDVHGTRVALLGLNTTDHALDEPAVRESFRVAREEHHADVVIVVIHWGEEYHERPTADQVSRAHWLIDQGADAVIGSHPHWMQSVETYRGRVIAYSLGNFVFDQDWSEETRFGLAVILGYEQHAFSLELFPVRIDNSQPRLLTGEERLARLTRLAQISDPSLREQILQGRILTRETAVERELLLR